LLLQLRGSRVATIGAEIEVVDQKPPRSDVLPKMAEALGVSVEDLLIVETGKTASRKAAKSNGRPAGKVCEVFDRVSKLPRRQQEHIVNWVSAYLSHYEQTRG
jgi:hypothetical protein